MDKMGIIFVYGTFRKGQYNHNRYAFDSKAHFIATVKLKGYVMYDLGFYPCIVPTGDEGDSVVGELYDFRDPAAEADVRLVEESAGYVEREVEVEGHRALVFIKETKPEKGKLVKSGDWTRRGRKGR